MTVKEFFQQQQNTNPNIAYIASSGVDEALFAKKNT